MLIKALLTGVLALPVHRADVELEVSPVVCRDVDVHVYGLPHGVHSPNHTVAELASSLISQVLKLILRLCLPLCLTSHLMGPGLGGGPVVSAHPAPALVILPLDAEAPAVKLIVVVVDRVGVTKPGDINITKITSTLH